MDADKKEYGMGISEGGDVAAAKKEKESRKGGAGALISRIFTGFLYAVFGYLLGICPLPFGTNPFGMAFLCAADRRLPYIFTGVCLSAFFSDKPVILLCAYSAALLIRVLVRLTLDNPWADDEDSGERSIGEVGEFLFSENICLRMTTACVGAFAVGIYSLIVGGFMYYDLYGAILGMIAAPAGVLISYGIFRGKGMATGFGYFSSGAVAFALVYSARAVSIYGVSLAVFGAAFVTLYICRKKGMTQGIATGIICGLAYSPIFAPSFIFAAIASGALWRVSAIFASVSAFTVGMAWALYVGGIGAVTSVMPALLAACLLFSVFDKIFFSAAKTVENEIPAAAECAVGYDILSAARLDATEQKVKNLCSAFSDMSAFFRDLGDRMRKPLAADIKQICDDAFDACCANCRRRELCWEENHTETIGAIASVSARVHRDGRISESDMPPAIREVCERTGDVVDEINHNCMLHTKQLLLCDKTEIFALDYEAVSELLAGAVSIDEGEYECNEELSQKLCAAFSSESLNISSVSAYGNRKKRISVRGAVNELRREREKISRIIGRVAGEGYSDGETEELEGAQGCLTFTRKKSIRVECATRSVMSEEESFCGDTVRLFENGEDRFYSLISDGMGSGRDAALTSGICAMFLQKMLTAANGCAASLKLLNGFLRNKGGGSMHECSATVDLMELDLIGGKASFYKSGAAPTYVFRDGSLFKLRSKTVPIGIIKELDAKKISFDVGDGDVIIMVSDGVTQGRDECPWLFELLKKNAPHEGLERTAQMIVDRARQEGGEDDVSVIMVKIVKE